MLESLIALLSIFIAVVCSNIADYKITGKKLTTTSSIGGAFTCVLAMKTLGKIGFTPNHIVQAQDVDYILLSINLLVSALAGILATMIYTKLIKKIG